MKYPEEFVLGLLAKQGAVDAYSDQSVQAGNRWREALDELEKARGEKGRLKFPRNYLLPLCFFIKGEFGIWIEALGGPEKRFKDLENREAEAQAEWDEEMMREREAEKGLNDHIDSYLRTTSLVYKRRSEVIEAIREIDNIAEMFYQEATDIRCDLIGFKKPAEFEEIRAAGMERMRVLLPEAVKGLESLEKYVAERADDGLVEPFSEWLTDLFDRLSSCELKSETMEATKHELDVILEIMRRMTNGTRNSDTDIEEWLAARIKKVKTLALKQAAES
ncbi:MAG TPA: hypothetical protein P5080_04535 [Candidatus Paceibacterota bacterium]|nr:hypothetical protein [Candidatus Pacearchaeota archaeon]HRZ51217.1 hypothetical protein [Candidatus Paceibacterota bacterium]HSA36939.1 hypothetical protein [Candidatus Paceibacterota bacterium]